MTVHATEVDGGNRLLGNCAGVLSTTLICWVRVDTLPHESCVVQTLLPVVTQAVVVPGKSVGVKK